jgi:hypothetical protein
MSCAVYRCLVVNWMILLNEPYTDQAAVAGYWEAVEHRCDCEVCRDEDVASGTFAIYRAICEKAQRIDRRELREIL